MNLLPGREEPVNLSEILSDYPEGVRPLLELHDVVLRGPSPLTVAQRELIAAYVSGLNECEFCFGAHSIIATGFGVDEAVFRALIDNPESDLIDARLHPLLAYIRKLTLTPSRLTRMDVQRVYDAGWDERALHDAVRVCALFSFMNRLVEGMGVRTNELILAAQRERHGNQDPDNASGTTYTDYGKEIGVL